MYEAFSSDLSLFQLFDKLFDIRLQLFDTRLPVSDKYSTRPDIRLFTIRDIWYSTIRYSFCLYFLSKVSLRAGFFVLQFWGSNVRFFACLQSNQPKIAYFDQKLPKTLTVLQEFLIWIMRQKLVWRTTVATSSICYYLLFLSASFHVILQAKTTYPLELLRAFFSLCVGCRCFLTRWCWITMSFY